MNKSIYDYRTVLIGYIFTFRKYKYYIYIFLKKSITNNTYINLFTYVLLFCFN